MIKIFVPDYSGEFPQSKEVEKIEIFRGDEFIGEIIPTEEGLKIEMKPKIPIEIISREQSRIED